MKPAPTCPQCGSQDFRWNRAQFLIDAVRGWSSVVCLGLGVGVLGVFLIRLGYEDDENMNKLSGVLILVAAVGFSIWRVLKIRGTHECQGCGFCLPTK